MKRFRWGCSLIVPCSLGDQVDETVEHHTGLHALVGVADERILDLRHRTVRTHLRHVVGVIDLDIGANDELLGVPGSSRVRDGETVRLERIVLLEAVVNVLLRQGRNHTHDVGLRINGVRSEQVRVPFGTTTAEQEETNRVALGAITEDLKQSVRATTRNLVGLASDGIGHEVAGVVTAVVQTGTGSLTVREEHGVNDLKAVVLAELGNDVHRSEDRLVKRRARQTEAVRHRVVLRPLAVVDERDGEQVHHRLLELIRPHLGRQEVEQREVVKPSNLVTLTVPTVRTVVHINLAVLVVLDDNSAERIDLERNVAPAAEQSDLHQLLDGIHQRGGHGTRPVDEHDESVILALADRSVATEDVVGDLVVHHANGVKNAGTRNRGTLRSVGGLAEIELLRHQSDDRRRLRHELVVLSLRLREEIDVTRNIRAVVLGRHVNAPVFDLLVDVRRSEDDVLQLDARQRLISVLALLVGIGHLLDRLIELLLSRGLGRSAGLVLHVATALTGSLGLALRSILVTLLVTLVATGALVLAGLLTGTRVGVTRIVTVTLLVRRIARHGNGGRLTLIVTLTVGGTVTVLLLLLGVLLHVGLVIPNVADDALDIIERAALVDAREERLLNGREVDTRSARRTHLVVQIDTVDERQRVEVAVLDAKEVRRGELLIRLEEVAAHTGETLLHQLLNAGVLHDVHVRLSERSVRSTGDLLSSTAPRPLHLLVSGGERSKQRVTDFVTDEHIVDLVGHASPRGKDENAVLHIERGGLRLGVVLHGNVFRSENARQKILAGGVDGAGGNGRGSGRNSLHRSTLYQNPVKRASLYQ